MILQPTQLVYADPSEWLGEGHPLVDQLGSASALMPLASVSHSLRLRPIDSLAAFRECLDGYHSRILLPMELPAIRRAFDHVGRNQLRELLQFDLDLAHDAALLPFTEPSRRTGRFQLRRLRPLRDVRFIQRYLAAVEREQAHAWHTLVYGLTLSVFSLPLHQGLLGYARQVTRGFIETVAPTLRLAERDCQQLDAEISGGLLPKVAAVLAVGG